MNNDIKWDFGLIANEMAKNGGKTMDKYIVIDGKKYNYTKVGEFFEGGIPHNIEGEYFPEYDTNILDGIIKIGGGTRVWGYSKLIGEISIGMDCLISSFCLLKGLAGPVFIGDYTRLQDYCFIDGPTHIGKHCFFGGRVIIGNDRFPMSDYNFGAVIGDDVIIGNGVVVVPGVTIGDRAVIGAGSVVTHDINPHDFVFGNPARVVGSRGDYETKKEKWVKGGMFP